MLLANSINKYFYIFLLIGAAACQEKARVTPTARKVRQLIPEEAYNIESLLSEPGKDSATGKLKAGVKGKLTAPYMLRYQRTDSPYAEFPRTLHVDFYNEAPQPQIES